MAGSERELNPVAMTITDLRKEADQAGNRNSDPLFPGPVRYWLNNPDPVDLERLFSKILVKGIL